MENNITAIEFQKSQKSKSKKETSMSARGTVAPKSSKSKPIEPERTKSGKKMKNSRSTIAVRQSDESSKNKEEEKRSLRGTKKQGDKSNLSSKDVTPTSHVSESRENSDKKNKSSYNGSSYGDKIKSRRSPKQRQQEKKSENNLSAYAEEASIHSSVVSNSSRLTKKSDVPAIPQIKENNYFAGEEIRQSPPREKEFRDEKMVEYDDFTDKQKKYIDKLLEEKLSIQKERMMEHFQSLQLEMIRQFQMQYLEVGDLIEQAVEDKKKRNFFDKYC